MEFTITHSVTPRIVDWFRTGNLRSGVPCLAVSHDGEPWGTAPYNTPLVGAKVRTFEVGGATIQFKEVTSKGSTVEVDGSVTKWQRPSIAYYSETPLDGIMDGQSNRGEGTWYVLPKKVKKPRVAKQPVMTRDDEILAFMVSYDGWLTWTGRVPMRVLKQQFSGIKRKDRNRIWDSR